MKSRHICALLMGVFMLGSAAGVGFADPVPHTAAPHTPDLGAPVIEKHAGIVDAPSHHSVDDTVSRLQHLLQSKQITLFALIDHSAEAAKVGMSMPATQLLIFGAPKAGTPLMLASPSIALDLPLKILVWQDAQGKV